MRESKRIFAFQLRSNRRTAPKRLRPVPFFSQRGTPSIASPSLSNLDVHTRNVGVNTRDAGFRFGGCCNPHSFSCCHPACFETLSFPNVSGSLIITTNFYARQAAVDEGRHRMPHDTLSCHSTLPLSLLAMDHVLCTSCLARGCRLSRLRQQRGAGADWTHPSTISASGSDVWPIARFSPTLLLSPSCFGIMASQA